MPMPLPSTPNIPNIAALQAYMRAERVGMWLIYDFRGSSGVLARLLPPLAGTKRWTTRRVLLAIPIGMSLYFIFGICLYVMAYFISPVKGALFIGAPLLTLAGFALPFFTDGWPLSASYFGLAISVYYVAAIGIFLAASVLRSKRAHAVLTKAIERVDPTFAMRVQKVSMVLFTVSTGLMQAYTF